MMIKAQIEAFARLKPSSRYARIQIFYDVVTRLITMWTSRNVH